MRPPRGSVDWMARTLRRAAAGDAKRLRYGLERPEEAQRTLLSELVRRASRTEYGQSHGLRPGDGLDEFRAKLPVVDYDALRPWVDRQREREGPVLVDEPVLLYEQTSGSSGASKYIPYTASLKRSFTRMFRVWAYDLLRHGPKLETAACFFSASPAFRTEQRTGNGVPIGLEDDADYLTGALRCLLKPFFVVPPEVKQLQEPRDFKHVLALHLLAAEGLEIISVWNPTLLLLMLDFMAERRASLLPDLRRGGVERQGLTFGFSPMSREREKAFKRHDWRAVWPKLKLLSCWTAATARRPALELQERFPGVLIQGKGLLATEAPMTVPLLRFKASVPLFDEVFFELIDGAGRARLLHEVEDGEEYSVVLSQRGGFLRYRIGDRVRVEGHVGGTPCLEFLGREATVSDLVGEKLHEAFVHSALEPLGDGYRLVLPDERGRRYVVLAEPPSPPPERVDAELSRAFHYRNARLLGQLEPPLVVCRPGMRARVHAYFVGRGMKWGNIKERVLLTHPAEAQALFAHCAE